VEVVVVDDEYYFVEHAWLIVLVVENGLYYSKGKKTHSINFSSFIFSINVHR